MVLCRPPWLGSIKPTPEIPTVGLSIFSMTTRFLKNLNLFVSSEIDLYKMVNGIPSNELTLTSLYLMLNYRISKRLSVSSSYDNRKNIIYYETYKNYIDVMLADATRQGVQLRINAGQSIT